MTVSMPAKVNALEGVLWTTVKAPPVAPPLVPLAIALVVIDPVVPFGCMDEKKS
jgi:hypothetical protein